jgi:hypothetical protein
MSRIAIMRATSNAPIAMPATEEFGKALGALAPAAAPRFDITK